MTSRERACAAFRSVSTAVEAGAGVKSHLGKLTAWCAGGGAAPADLALASPTAWTADKPDEENGVNVLGTPLGRPAFVAKFVEEKIADEKAYLHEIGKLQDPQCAWLMLSM